MKDLQREYVAARRVLDECGDLDDRLQAAAAAKDENLRLLVGADGKMRCRGGAVDLLRVDPAPEADGGGGPRTGVVLHFALDLPTRLRILWAATFVDGRLVPGRIRSTSGAEARVVLHLLDEEAPRPFLVVVDRKVRIETGARSRLDLLVSARAGTGDAAAVDVDVTVAGPAPADCARRPRHTRYTFGIGMPLEFARPPGQVQVPMRACLTGFGAVARLSTASPRHPRLLAHALDTLRLRRFEPPGPDATPCCIPLAPTFERVN